MLPHVGPMLALCWPKLALACPHLAPILPLSWPYVAPSCRQIWPNYVKTPSTCHFFRSGTPPAPQNHVKRFFDSAKMKFRNAEGPKHPRLKKFNLSIEKIQSSISDWRLIFFNSFANCMFSFRLKNRLKKNSLILKNRLKIRLKIRLNIWTHQHTHTWHTWNMILMFTWWAGKPLRT